MDFDAAEMALYHNPSLKEFSMTDCEPAVAGISMDTLVLLSSAMGTLGSIPSSTTKTTIST